MIEAWKHSARKNETLNGAGTEDIGSDTSPLAVLDILVKINGGCFHLTFLIIGICNTKIRYSAG